MDNYTTATTDENDAFSMDKLMDAIAQIKALPKLPVVTCHPESIFSNMGIKVEKRELMPENMALVMQDGKIIQMWKLENETVTAYEFKEPLSIFYPGVEFETTPEEKRDD